jgi:hypothetical protein
MIFTLPTNYESLGIGLILVFMMTLESRIMRHGTTILKNMHNFSVNFFIAFVCCNWKLKDGAKIGTIKKAKGSSI